MEIIQNVLLGLSVATTPMNFGLCLLGVALGTFIGLLPGIGAPAAVAMLLPITFHLPPSSALIMLSGIFYGASYGGAIASILLNVPGTPNSAVTCLEGYPMAKEGRGGVALFISAIASFIGGTVGIVFIMFAAPLMVSVATHFGPAEYCSLMILALIAASSMGSSTSAKGMVMVVTGLLLATAGTDLYSGIPRFSFGIAGMYDGFSLIAVAMGIFGVSEVISSIRTQQFERLSAKAFGFRAMLPTLTDWKRSVMPILRGTGIGTFFGVLPGTGSLIASFVAYSVEKKVSRTPERFGTGAIEGVASPEAANNAADQAAFVPTLTLGIPGNVVMAIMLGALMIHGITPGPRFIIDSPDIFWGLVMSFWIGNILLLILNIPMIGIWVRIVQVPYQYLYPAILLLICIGVYSVKGSVLDLYTAIAFGVLGYGLRLADLPAAPLILGFVLEPLLEQQFRRAMLLSRGDFMTFLDRPISAVILGVSVLLILYSSFDFLRRSFARHRYQPAGAGDSR